MASRFRCKVGSILFPIGETARSKELRDPVVKKFLHGRGTTFPLEVEFLILRQLGQISQFITSLYKILVEEDASGDAKAQ